MLLELRLVRRDTRQLAWLSGLVLLCGLLLSGCKSSEWNNPYPVSQQGENILYSSFSSRPKHLDPVRSYSSNEYAFIGQIYEPPLQYHYLKRPYELTPLTAVQMPTVSYLDAAGHLLPPDGPVASKRSTGRARSSWSRSDVNTAAPGGRARPVACSSAGIGCARSTCTRAARAAHTARQRPRSPAMAVPPVLPLLASYVLSPGSPFFG